MERGIVTAGKVTLVFFPDEALALNKEVQNHPKLVEQLSSQGNKDFIVLLAEIAAYCAIALDGAYDEADIKNICRHCTDRLISMRTGLIL